MKNRKIWLSVCLMLAAGSLLMLAMSGKETPTPEQLPALPQTSETAIVLSDEQITVNGEAAPAEPGHAVYLSRDIVYYEDRDAYDSGNPYGEGTQADRHSAEEAAGHTVVNITEPGVYRLSGTLSAGQIAVDLGKQSKTDPEAVVTLILDNADITCTVAPAVIFYNVYECDTGWTAYDGGEAEGYEASAAQDTSKAGANVILADDSVNTVRGSYVARIYKDAEGQKKAHKYDGAFYSKRSMNVSGEEKDNGVLNIIAENEGLDSELHLTINGGKINIHAQNDGINTNEDNVSVTTVNGGSLHIVAGLGEEGDGIDSNGYLVINGGVVVSIANPRSDAGLDSDCGSFINGGTVIATGSTMDWAESDSEQVTMNLRFAGMQESDEAVIVTTLDGKVLFAYDPEKDETTGAENRGYRGAILSSPAFQTGESYYVYVGGDVFGEETDGLYDCSTVTGFEGAVRQEYTGTDVGGPRGGRPPMPPEGMEGRPPEFPGRGERPERPEGWKGRPEPPDGHRPPDGRKPSDGFRPPFEGENTENLPGSAEFLMKDRVNGFSGVRDETKAE